MHYTLNQLLKPLLNVALKLFLELLMASRPGLE